MIGRSVYQSATPRCWRRWGWALPATPTFALGIFLSNLHQHSIGTALIDAAITGVASAVVVGLWIWLHKRDGRTARTER